jgi:hypothetical protein
MITAMSKLNLQKKPKVYVVETDNLHSVPKAFYNAIERIGHENIFDIQATDNGIFLFYYPNDEDNYEEQ